MRTNITLYIGGQRVDLSEESLVLLTYTFEDLSNPTIVKNSYSKTLKLPGTQNNDRLFGEFWKLDRVTRYTGDFTGSSFDASRKTPFQIFDDLGEVLVSGYCRLDSVHREGAAITYDVTLFGNLGTFLDNLTYNEDGSKKSLADLTFFDMDGNRIKGSDITLGIGPGVVISAWDYLEDPDKFQPQGRYDLYYNILNFAPCYNGFPPDFDANKAICSLDSFDNIPGEYKADGKTYSAKPDTSHLLVTYSKPHTEWEVCDLRWYLQRPVLSVREFIKAIADPINNGGYEVKLDPKFFSAGVPEFQISWLTLPLVAKEDRKSFNAYAKILAGSETPADILLSLVKMFGLVILCDRSAKKAQILKRSSFFLLNADPIDLEDRVSLEGMKIQPNVADHRFYQMGGARPVIGEWAKAYARDFGREYAIQRINTGYDFDQETTIITKNNKLTEAADVLENSQSFVSESPYYRVYNMPLSWYESIKIQYWSTTPGDFNSLEVAAKYLGGIQADDNDRHPYYDWLPKVQLHDENNKPAKVGNLVLFYNGMKETPDYLGTPRYWQKTYQVSDDTADMLTLNNGKPCWIIENPVKYPDNILMRLPYFARTYAPDGKIQATADYGEPLARGVFGVTNPNGLSIYSKFWKRYLSDRYDTDTKILRCKVNLEGFRVDQALLGRFFYFGGALWVLNKVDNYSITSNDLTDCEFIKVKSKENYIL